MLRRSMGAIVLASLVLTPEAGLPSAVAASSSCTGWTSKTVPPPVIRVLRTGSGRVQTVDFRRYVAEVMASGEWPSRRSRATLEAGAVATKQYAWYYTLKGNHRSGYRRNGTCYDVRDDTHDQLFRPERVRATSKQQRAIEATWGLTLRKRGRFFLTGYRLGSSSRCAADANGWKLYERSVDACARKGWSRRRIQQAYYAPHLTFVWTTTLGPPLRKPKVRLRSGNTVAAGAATVSWRRASSRLRVARYRLQRKVGSGRWQDVELSSPRATKASVPVAVGRTNRFRVYATDPQGRRGPWAYSPKRLAALRGPANTTLSGGGAQASSSQAEAVRIRFQGHSVALLAPTAPDLGRVKILLGRRRVATVDLGRTPATDHKLVWARNFAHARKRSIKVVPVGGSARVDFEGFLVLR